MTTAQYFSRYRIRVANVCRDYMMEERAQAPEDSNAYLCEKVRNKYDFRT